MADMITIRPLELKDATQIKLLDTEGDFEIYSFIEDMLEEQEDERKEQNNDTLYTQNYAYGIFENKKLVGYCTIGGADEIEETENDSELLGDVFVKEDFRNKGYAVKLIEYVLSVHNQFDVYSDILYDELEAFYVRFGFKRVKLGLLVLQR